MILNKDEEILDYCKKCNVELDYITAYIDHGYECPKCKDNDFLPNGNLDKIEYKRKIITIEILEPLVEK